VGQTYEVRAYLVQDTCWADASDTGNLVTVDFGSTERRATGGGWVANQYSMNGKANFGFTVGLNKNGTLKGNSVYMLHSVLATDGRRDNWKVKDSSWTGGTLTFYQSTGGTKIDSARFTAKCVVQQIDSVTGQVLSGGFGNGTIVVDIYDGDQYNPKQKDKYSIKVFMQDGVTLWWGSSSSLLQLGGGGPGGGNVTIFQ